MNPMRIAVAPARERELLITRIYDAPLRLVWQAWTEPEHIVRWLAPRGMMVSHSEGELRPGGAWRSCMLKPDGSELWLSGEYQEVLSETKLSFTHAWEDGAGKRGHETVVTVTFEAIGKKTKLTLHQALFDSLESRDGHRGGWGECLDKLGEHLREQRA